MGSLRRLRAHPTFDLPGIPPASLLLLVLLLLPLRHPPLVAQTSIQGRVVDAETGEGIASAGVLVMSGERLVGTAITGSTGLYAIRVDASGPLLLRASRQGYRSAALDSVSISAGSTTNVPDLRLEPAPIVLPEVRAETPRSRLTPGSEWIRRNQLLGKGTFFSGAMIRQIDPPSLTRYIAGETNLWVRYDEKGIPSIGNPFGGCRTLVVLMNRWPIYDEFTIDGVTERVGWLSMDEIPIDRIAAIEVYNDMRDLPPMLYFTHEGDPHVCGVINIWTWDAYY